MNGAQDVGGMQTFGPVVAEQDEPVFHAEWEKRVMALTVAMGGAGVWNLDTSRATRESLPPAEYWSVTYYEIWLRALEKLMLRNGLLSPEELASGKPLIPPVSIARRLSAEQVPVALAKGSPAVRPVTAPPRFQVGQRVRTREMNIPTHTRLPRYCRDKPGVIVKQHGVHVFPDTNAVGQGEQPQWLYSVRFESTDLWGAEATARSAVHVDCWESYLDADH